MKISQHFTTRLTVLAAIVSLGGCLSEGSEETQIAAGPVAPANSAPIISGTPSSSVMIGAQYSFTPSASDADNDQLTFDVQGEPNWLTINSATGALTGTPTLADVGSFSGIVVSVSDGSTSASLPQFSINVVQDAPANNAPTISGTPGSSVLVDEQYSFTPSASDADNDTLTFDVQGQPNWLSINSDSGALTGTPTVENVGSYSGIVVSVSDGSASASLPQFGVDVVQNADGSITLSWTAPTLNEDGSALTDLAGYKIYYGTSSGSYPNEVRIDGVGTTTHVVDNLTPDTYYFVATAFNASEVESRHSGEAIKSVN